MSVTIAILGLALLILIHEAGHFFTAVAVGMRPRRFYLGFPPPLAKTTRRGIEYGIGAIPLGGYVKIPGMHRPAPSDVDGYFGGAQYEEPDLVGPAERLKRSLDCGDHDEAGRALDELEASLERADLSPAAARTAERGVSEIRDALSAQAYWRQRTWKRIAVIFAGPGTNLVFAILLLGVVYMIGVPTAASRKVDGVIAGSPAEKVGLRHGDEILAIDHHPTRSYKQVTKRIRASDGHDIVVTVRRHGRRVDLPPQATEKKDGRWAFGFYVQVRYESYGPGRALVLSTQDMWRATKGIGSALGRIVTGSGRKEISSPVGIVSESSKAVRADYRYYLEILALLSLSLALLNLLPLLPLDGGHIAFSVIEGLRGRAVGRAVYERVSAVGIAVVLLLFVIGLSNDIGRLSGG